MKKTNRTLIKRITSICLALTILLTMANMEIQASDSSESKSVTDDIITTCSDSTDEVSDENNTIIFHDYETDETIEAKPDNQKVIVNTNEECVTNIIGKDDRKHITDTLGSPQRNVCFIEVHFSDGFEARGTGTLVNFDVVLTAGHVIYQHNHGGYATSIEVVPAMVNYISRPLPASKCNGKTAMPSGWINSHNYNYDWAVFKLTKSYDTYQLYGFYKDNSVEVNRTVVTYGYPCDSETNMMSCTGKVLSATDYTMNINNDMAQGDSGGPIIDESSGYLVGVFSTMHKNGFGIPDYNTAVKINQTVVNAIKAISNN